MKYEDKVDIYNDLGKCIAEDIPIEALSPLYNPYIRKLLRFFRNTAFIDLKKLETIIKTGRLGWETSVGQDEVKMPHYGRDWPILEKAEEIAEKVREKVAVKPIDGEQDESEVRLIADNQVLMVQIPNRRMDVAAGRDPAYTASGIALAQALSEIFDVNPETDATGCAVIKTAIFGRYPQSIRLPPGSPLFAFLKASTIQEGLGTGFKCITINHLVALANKRTFDAIALASILEQGAQLDMGNAIGWFERYHLLGMAYQGFNANNVVLDLVKENHEGTVGDVVRSLMKRTLEDEVIRPKGDKYPDVQFSGYKLYTSDDMPLWNAYSCAGLLAACIVNVGASRAAQGVSSVLGSFPDLLLFESGGLPDPDFGRIMGTGLGLCFYTHAIYGGAGPGAYTMDHVIVRHTSGFFTPCIAAAMCLDAGTQIFSPDMTSATYFKIRKEAPIVQDPYRKVVEAAEQIKDKI